MIKVKVQTILAGEEAAGGGEMEITLPEEDTVESLLRHVLKAGGDRLSSHLFEPGRNRLLSHIRLMVNGRDMAVLNGMESIVKDGDEVVVGDEVLLFPPFGGG